jgi:hypothetical protein
MMTEQLREAHQATPFRPFRVHLADGKTLEVPHPEFMWIMPDDRTAGIWKATRGAGYGAASLVDIELITKVEFIRAGRGAKKKS